MKSVLILIWITLVYLSNNVNTQCSQIINNFKGYTCSDENPIGSGASAKAYLVERDHTKYVLKSYIFKARSKDQSQKTILKRLDDFIDHHVSPFIIKRFERQANQQSLYEIIEFGENGELGSFMEKNPAKF